MIQPVVIGAGDPMQPYIGHFENGVGHMVIGVVFVDPVFFFFAASMGKTRAPANGSPMGRAVTMRAISSAGGSLTRSLSRKR